MAYEYTLIGVEGSYNKGERQYTHTYKLTTQDLADKGIGPGTACSLVPGILYTPYVYGGDTDLLATLKQKSARSVDGLTWEVTLNWDSEPFESGDGTQDAGGGGTDPTDPATMDASTPPDERPWTITPGSNQTQKPFVKDVITGDPITMSNGQPVDPPIMLPASVPTLTISGWKLMADDNWSNKLHFEDSINDAVWTLAGQSFAAKRLRCVSYDLKPVYLNHSWYWEKTVVVEYNPDRPFNPVLYLDQGTYELYATAPLQRPIEDHGNPVSAPVLLDGAGKKLASGAAAVYRSGSGYIERDWTSIL